jgi:nucleoside phosphorylase
MISAALLKLGDKFARPPAELDKVYVEDRVVEHPTDKSRRPDFPRVHSGTIGTADTLLKSDVTRDDLRDRFGVRAVEMEASGLQNAAWAQGRDVFVIRGICDYCDKHKNDDWQYYAALVAAAYSRALIEAMPSEWFASPMA